MRKQTHGHYKIYFFEFFHQFFFFYEFSKSALFGDEADRARQISSNVPLVLSPVEIFQHIIIYTLYTIYGSLHIILSNTSYIYIMYSHKKLIQLSTTTTVSTWKVYVPVPWYNVDLPCVENWCTSRKYVKRKKIEEGHVSIFLS